jgi:hypothetical protein
VLKFGALASLVGHQHFERIDGVVRWRDGPVVPNAERVVSPYETDARASRKRDTEWLGYKVHLTETCSEEEAVHLIVQAEVTAATVQDVELTMPLLPDLQTRNLVPEVRLVDSGYVSGQVLAEHAELGIELVGPLKQEGGWQHETGYGVSAILRGLAEAAGVLSESGTSHRTGALDDTTEARR